MKLIKHLLFDLDGTILDSADGIVEAVNYSLEKVGAAPRNSEEIIPHIGYPLSQMYPKFTDVPHEVVYRHFSERANTTVVEAAVPFEGVDDMLDELIADGYALSIVTTKCREHLDGVLRKLAWTDKFLVTISNGEVSNIKPHPEPFQKAVKLLGVELSTCLAIGDTVNDVLSAQGVPIRVAAVRSPYGRHQEVIDAHPDHFLETITDLPLLLAGINSVQVTTAR